MAAQIETGDSIDDLESLDTLDDQPGRVGEAHLAGLARGSTLNLVGAICSQVSLFAITALIAAKLGSVGVGRYALCFALLSLLGLLSLCGFRSALTRFIAIHLADNDPGRIRGTVRLGMGLSVVSSIVLGAGLVLAAPLLAKAFNDPDVVTGIRFIGLTLPASTISDAALSATQGWRTQRPFTLIGRIFEPVLRLVLTAAALFLGFGLTGTFWALLIAAWLAAALAVRSLLTRLRRVAPAKPIVELGPIFGFSMVSWGSTMASTGLIWADTLILGVMTTTSDVGIYNVATRLVTLAVFVMAPINAAFGPQIAHLHHRGETQALEQTYSAATSWILRLSLPAFVALIVFPRDLLHLFGHGYSTAAIVTAILACGQLINAATGPCGTLLNMSGRVSLNMYNNIGVLVLNIGLNIALIPPFGIVGSAIAWSVSLAVVNLLRVAQVRRIVGITPVTPAIFKSVGAAVAAAVVGVAILLAPWSWPVELTVGLAAICVVYLAVTFALGLSRNEQLMLASLGRRRGGQRPQTPPVEVSREPAGKNS